MQRVMTRWSPSKGPSSFTVLHSLTFLSGRVFPLLNLGALLRHNGYRLEEGKNKVNHDSFLLPSWVVSAHARVLVRTHLGAYTYAYMTRATLGAEFGKTKQEKKPTFCG